MLKTVFEGRQLGIDLGTTTVRICVKGKGVVLREPAVVALTKATGELRAVGEEAYRLLGRAPGEVVALRPLRDGVVADEALTEAMLGAFLRRVTAPPARLLGRALGGSATLCVPAGASEQQQGALLAVVRAGGVKQAHLIEAPLAAALGAGLPVTDARGVMVVDLGGGTTEVAVIALGGVVLGETLRVAGNTFDEAVVRTVRARYGALIGNRTAEEAKRQLGAARASGPAGPPLEAADVRGRDLKSGLPRTVTLTREDVDEALAAPLERLVSGVQRLLETAPPELTADVLERGLTLTGGGAALRGASDLLRQHTGLPVTVAPNAPDCAVLGACRAPQLADRLQRLAPERGP